MLAFVSGLNFGGLGDEDECQNAMLLLANFLRGNHPSKDWQALSRQISRLIIVGDSVAEPKRADDVRRESYSAQSINIE